MFLFEKIGIIDEQFGYKPDMYVGIEGKRIAYISDVPPVAVDITERYNGKGKLLCPAFVNAHAHSPMTLLRGYAENLSLNDWLFGKIFPFEAKLKPDDIYNGTLLAAAEMIRYGCVSATDMYFFGEQIIKAVLETGIKTSLSVGTTCFDENIEIDNLPNYIETVRLFNEYNNAEDERIKVDFSIHAEYTSNPKIVAATAERALKYGGRMQLHLSETNKEHQECKARHGKTPSEYFSSLGLFDVPTTAAHCVWLEGDDFDILAQKGVTVANCPVSNLKLASGIAKISTMLEKGINVALGTDGCASNNNLNLLEELKLYALLCKGTTGDPTLITPSQALKAATLSGAVAQGRTDCGSIKSGNRADLTVFSVSAPNMLPVYNMLNNLVYSATADNIILTMCDGKILYKDGEYTTLDIERIRALCLPKD